MKIYDIKYILSVFDFKNRFDFVNKVFDIKFWISNIPINYVFLKCIKTLFVQFIMMGVKCNTIATMSTVTTIIYYFNLQKFY